MGHAWQSFRGVAGTLNVCHLLLCLVRLLHHHLDLLLVVGWLGFPLLLDVDVGVITLTLHLRLLILVLDGGQLVILAVLVLDGGQLVNALTDF